MDTQQAILLLQKNTELEKELALKTRELEIEAALERVRARAMAMHESGELKELIATVSAELSKLDFTLDRSFIIIYDAQTAGSTWWMSHPESPNPVGLFIKYHEHAPYLEQVNAWRERKLRWEYLLGGDEKKNWDEFLFHETDLSLLPQAVKEAMTGLPNVYISASHNNFGALTLATVHPLSNEQFDILLRFAKVFDLTYTRFNDLQQAEAQAREAKIEAALERVRSRAMAMHKSEELKEVVKELRKQIGLLGQDELNTCVIHLYDESPEYIQAWVSIQQSENNDEITEFNGKAPKKGLFIIEESLNAYSSGRKDYTLLNEKDKLKQWMGFLKKNYPEIYAVILESYKGLNPDEVPVYWSYSHFNGGALLMVTLAPAAEDSKILLRKFANVFGLAYRRFIDLKQAEAQAREAKIEAALEKVRSASLAMHRSDELKDVIIVVFEKLKELGLIFEGSGIQLFTEGSKDIVQWVMAPDHLAAPILAALPYTEKDYNESEIVRDMWMAKEKWKNVYNKCYSFDEKNSFFKYAAKYNDFDQIPVRVREFQMQAASYTMSLVAEKHSALWVDSYSGQTISLEGFNVLERIAKVFDQAYTRFLDLQKAEAQAREARIEAALEKVRSRSLAMHKSDELKDVIVVVFEKLKELGVLFEDVGIQLFKPGIEDLVTWVAAPDHLSQPVLITLPYEEEQLSKSVIFREYQAAKKNEVPIYNRIYSFEEKNGYFDYIDKYFGYVESSNPGIIPQQVRDYQRRAPSYTVTLVPQKNSALIVDSWKGQLISIEDFDVLQRMAKVFEQAYTRFLDLQKAEAQTRESQIQLAMERVRARTMAMQKSGELADVAELLFKQVSALGIQTWTTGFNIWRDDNNGYEDWITNPKGGFIEPYSIDSTVYYVFRQVSDAKKRGEEFYVQYEEGETLKETYRWLSKFADKKQFENILESGFQFPLRQYDHFVFGSKVSLMFITYEPVPEAHDIFKRFGKVFEQTYTRFLDLQKAEAQAREALIEAALERVRSRSMGMHKSEEVMDVAVTLYDQLQKLDFKFGATTIIIMDEKTGNMQHWLAGFLQKNHVESYEVNNIKHPLHAAQLAAWRKGEKFVSIDLSGPALKGYAEEMFTQTGYKNLPDEEKAMLSAQEHAVFNLAYMRHGALMWAPSALSDENAVILQRFAKVFEQTYTRFLDLQKAETQAREAQVEAALERVRSRTLAMQKSDELAETSAVLFQQLIQLGISPNRLYISIMKNNDGKTEFWITDEDGSKVSMAYEDNLNNNASFKKMFDGWKEQKTSLVIDMKGKELNDYLHYLESIHVPFKGGLTQTRRWQYIAYFSKGFIGMASPEEQPAETLQLLERFAYVFNLTFTRFNDLQIAEAHAVQAEHDLIEIKAARKKAEDALSELQITQKQLIQSEKMASLGELVAGIAHEIQNPLNFVNNFSEVNRELIEELKNQKEKLKSEELDDLLNDISDNEEKINHHGKRADAIVKGMLEHSRKSEGKKEPTDINALCDEYLRLAYHGMKAKDKAFNAEITTDFDETIGKINIVRHDIGRVLLNLINNAFYAVNEKARLTANGYQPTAVVTTKKLIDSIEIRVKDNGNGIAQNIIDKIFQPFFTTKPTGQGTGLGLSLAYDIIKAHGGEIKVETKEGEGSRFTITIPKYD